MTAEQLSFANQQLAGLLRSGIPLEGALRRLCTDMQAGRLRDELRALEADLARGIPLAEALTARRLPPLYSRMLQLGGRSQDLPAVLVLLADYYQRQHLLWTRLSGLLVYPVLVFLGTVALSVFLAFLAHQLLADPDTLGGLMGSGAAGQPSHQRAWLWLQMWAPVAGLSLAALTCVVGFLLPPVRRRLRWRLPGFQETALAQLASSLHLLLSRGCPLGDALHLARQLESDSPVGRELERWHRRLAEGHARFAELSEGCRQFPPLFLWLVAQGAEDLASGFKRAAELYYQRALHRTEVLLYLALPVSIMVLGTLVLGGVAPLVRLLVLQLNVLGDAAGGL